MGGDFFNGGGAEGGLVALIFNIIIMWGRDWN